MQRRNFITSFTAMGTGMFLGAASPFAALSQQSSPPPNPQVKRVLIMFKCHFDAGFIDTQAAVVHKYFSEFFPKAIEVAAHQRAIGNQRYVWTTGSWLLYEYLEQASPEDRKRMEQAIGWNDIAWHALPFSWQTELLDPDMITGGLALSQSLDRRFGRVTTGAKMTDVPGHTRGLIAPMASNGVKFLDIGVNSACSPAELPMLFLWKDATGASLPVMFHKDYGAVAQVPGSDLAIAIEVRDDNTGPHTPEEIAAIYSGLAHQFPSAEITAANLSQIATAVDPLRSNLPVFSGEIGDTWIHGIASDPLKVMRYREMSRLRNSWLAGRKLKAGDATDLALLRQVLLEVEHTWGTDTKTWLDFDHYKPADLAKMLETKNYKVVQFSWVEKRQDLLKGIATLPAPLQAEAQQAIAKLVASEPRVSARARRQAPTATIETTHFLLGFDEKTGALTRLRNKSTKREWASPSNPIALFSYQTLSKKDYDRFIADYLVLSIDWAFKDFGKPNIERFGAESREWFPVLSHLDVEEDAAGHRLLATLNIQDAEAFQSGLASFPQKIYLELTLPSKEPVIYLNISWFQKPATRLPEAIWLTFNPVADDPQGWMLEKSGQRVSPFEVVTAGNRHMHALSRGFGYKDGSAEFLVDTIDAPLVALGDRTPLGFTKSQPDLAKGIHCNLLNNAWGTNYLMWYGEDMRYRFVLRA
jgi:Domain of unknown function (DUF5054)